MLRASTPDIVDSPDLSVSKSDGRQKESKEKKERRKGGAANPYMYISTKPVAMGIHPGLKHTL